MKFMNEFLRAFRFSNGFLDTMKSPFRVNNGP